MRSASDILHYQVHIYGWKVGAVSREADSTYAPGESFNPIRPTPYGISETDAPAVPNE